ncbi:DUF3795 domain-containing protein [Methanoculleus sediminis]|nr:DUF3795 domain-containing protein [Methanoculleus sediminis]
MARTTYPDFVGMCGVNCALAPCFLSGRCRGCRSEDPRQKRTSKWKCRIRRCVLERQLNHCGECPEFPCPTRGSLDKRYRGRYRIDLAENIRRLTALGPEEWGRQVQADYTCPSCGGCIDPYRRTCSACGRPMD